MVSHHTPPSSLPGMLVSSWRKLPSYSCLCQSVPPWQDGGGWHSPRLPLAQLPATLAISSYQKQSWFVRELQLREECEHIMLVFQGT